MTAIIPENSNAAALQGTVIRISIHPKGLDFARNCESYYPDYSPMRNSVHCKFVLKCTKPGHIRGLSRTFFGARVCPRGLARRKTYQKLHGRGMTTVNKDRGCQE